MKQNTSHNRKPLLTAASLWLLPAAVALCVLLSSFGLYRSLIVQDHDQIAEIVKASATDIRDDIKDGMKSTVLSIARIARRWEVRGKPSLEQWQSEAGIYVGHYPGYEGMAWVDPSFHAQWSVSSQNNEETIEALAGSATGLNEAQKAALMDAMSSREARLTPLLYLPHGQKFMEFVPIFSDKGFDGFIAVIFDGQALIDSYIHDYHKRDYSITVSIGEEQIYKWYDGPEHNTDFRHDMEINQYGVKWRVSTWPNAEYLAKMRSPLPEWTLAMGIITSLILTSLVYFAQAKRMREEELEKTNEMLKGEIVQRTLAEEELSKYRDHLEELVEARTTELKTVNKQLRWEIDVRKSAEEAVEKYALELERSNADLEQFAYVASHDLQEPLRIVVGYAQLLSRRYKEKLDKEADEFISYAVDGANRMHTLINDLLKYSRVGAPGNELAKVDCEHIFNHTIGSLQATISERGVVITHDPLPSILANTTQMEQVFINLISNGIKYNRENQPRVHVSASMKKNEWLFSVRDNGIGIDPKYHSRIFLIFQRLHSKAEYSGTGIGLAICKKVVEKHGGRMWVESEAGKGSTFYFTIPNEEVKNEQAT